MLHGLVHRRDVVERVLRVGRESDVRGREHIHDGVVGNSARQLHLALQSQLVAQCLDLVVRVACTHEGKGDVVPAEVMHDVGSGPHRQVDAVLGSHDADVGHEVPPAAAQRRDGGPPPQALVVGAGPHHGDVLRALATTAFRDLGVRGVRGDDVVGCPEGGLLQSE